MYESYSMKIGSNIPWFIPWRAHQGPPDGVTGWNIGVYMRIGLWNFLRESYLTSKVTLSAIGNIEYALTQKTMFTVQLISVIKIMELLEHYRKLLLARGTV